MDKVGTVQHKIVDDSNAEGTAKYHADVANIDKEAASKPSYAQAFAARQDAEKQRVSATIKNAQSNSRPSIMQNADTGSNASSKFTPSSQQLVTPRGD